MRRAGWPCAQDKLSGDDWRGDRFGGRAPRRGVLRELREVVKDLKWWTHEDILRSDETFYPAALKTHLADLLPGVLPDTPLRLDARLMTEPLATPVADAAPLNWVDRHAPAFMRPYARLARLDRPIGTWLLLWPCLWSISLATPGLPDLSLVALFALGAIVMRGAGCTYNDIVDRDIDGQVARTRARPLPSGDVRLWQAVTFLIAQLLIGLGVLLSLNSYSVWLGFGSLLLIAIYPFMKRVTHWPQAVLGLAFNWGALMGWSAVVGHLDAAPIILYVGSVFWTIGYDTIYAHQDKEDDAVVGVKSTALKFGASTPCWLTGFYSVMILALAITGAMAGLNPVFYAGVALAALHLAWQVWRIDVDDGAMCLARFRSNRDFGAIVFAAVLVAQWLG